MVANALWGRLQQWKQTHWQCRGNPIWAAALWLDTVLVENLVVKIYHVDACMPESHVTNEHRNNKQVNQDARTEVVEVDLD